MRFKLALLLFFASILLFQIASSTCYPASTAIFFWVQNPGGTWSSAGVSPFYYNICDTEGVWHYYFEQTSHYDGRLISDQNDCRSGDHYNIGCSLGTTPFCEHTETSPTYSETINWDLLSENCLCHGKNWNIGGETAATTCCGDDSNEYRKVSTYDTSMDGTADGTDGCCTLNTDCMDANTCYNTGLLTHDADGDSDNDYCSSGTWYDCSTDTQCSSSQYCSGNDCLAKKSNGNTCTASNQCTSGNCIDGYCCNNDCIGNCNSCAVDGSLGTCTNVDATCSGTCAVCNGNCEASASLCTGNCDTCSGSGTEFNCTASATLCTGNCDTCSGSGTEFNCAAVQTDCSACYDCTGSGTSFSCSAVSDGTGDTTGTTCDSSTTFCCGGTCVNAGGEYGGACGSGDCVGTWGCSGTTQRCSDYGSACDYCSGDNQMDATCTVNYGETCSTGSGTECAKCTSCLDQGETTTCSATTGVNHYTVGTQDSTGSNKCEGTDYCMGDASCCGDTSSEYYKTCSAGTWETHPGGNAVCTVSSDDEECCTLSNDCVYNGACYAHGTRSDVDGDGVLEYCRDSVWHEGIVPTYVGVTDVTGCDYEDTSGKVCWVKQGTTFYFTIEHSDADSTPYRAYFGFNNGCSPNGCGGAPDEIKSYGDVDVMENSLLSSSTDWMYDNNYIDIVAGQCVTSGGCIDATDVKIKWWSVTGASVGEINRDIYVYLYDNAWNGVGYTNTGWDLKVDNTNPTNPTISSPAVNAIVSTTPTLDWTDASDSRSGLSHYNIEVDDDSGFGSPAVDTTETISTHTVASALSECTTYYWKVQSEDNIGYTGDFVGGASNYFRTSASNADTCSYVCTEEKGYDWFASVTGGNNDPCCGDDGTNDNFENTGASNSCCIYGNLVTSGSVSGSNAHFMCYNGDLYSCNSAGTYTFDTDKSTNDVIGSQLCIAGGWYAFGVDDDNSGEDLIRDTSWDAYASTADDVCIDAGNGDYGDMCRGAGWAGYGVCAAGGVNGICVELDTYWIIDSDSSWDTGSLYYSSNPSGDQNGRYCTGKNIYNNEGVNAPTFCADKSSSGWAYTTESDECASGTDKDGDTWIDEFFKWDESGGTCVECDPATKQKSNDSFTSPIKPYKICEEGCGASSECDEYAPLSCGAGPNDANGCDESCQWIDRDSSQTSCESSTGCNSFVWVEEGYCCGNDGIADDWRRESNSRLCLDGIMYNCNNDNKGYANYTQGAKVGSYYCTSASNWTTSQPDVDLMQVSCEYSDYTWFGGSSEEGCCEPSEEFVYDGLPQEDLVLYFKFDEALGSKVVDEEVNGFTATLSGDVIVESQTVDTVRDNSLEFSGTSGIATVQENELLNITNAISISFWIKPDTTDTDEIIVKNNNANTGPGAYEVYQTGGKINFKLYSGASPTILVGSLSLIQNKWNYVVVTWDGTLMKEYVNDVLDSTTQSFTGPIDKTTGDLSFGSYANGNYYYQGHLDEVMIWDAPLTQADVETLYRSFPERNQNDIVMYVPFEEGTDNTASDAGPNTNDLSLQGASWASADEGLVGKLGEAIFFNNLENDFATVSLSKISPPFTISFWVKQSSTQEYANRFVGLVGWRTSNEILQGIILNETNNEIVFRDYGGGSDSEISTGVRLENDAFTHIVLVHDGTNVKVYVDANKEIDQAWALSLTDSNELQVGGINDGISFDRDFIGIIDELYIFNKTLTQDEINYYYGGKNWRKYACNDSSLISCGLSDDCSKKVSDSGISYYCYGEKFVDYREVTDLCEDVCTGQGGTWVQGGGERECCISSTEYWCNESIGIDNICYGGLIYSCENWCDRFGTVNGLSCTSDVDGDCTASDSCSSDGYSCECKRSSGSSCNGANDCDTSSECISEEVETIDHISKGSLSNPATGNICCPSGDCAYNMINVADNIVDSCAVNGSTLIDIDNDGDLEYCDNGIWKECVNYIAENHLANDCSCVGSGITMNNSGNWLCRAPPISFTYDTSASCGTLCDSDSDTNTLEMLDENGNCIQPSIGCNDVLTQSSWSGNTSLITASVTTKCPCGQTATCVVSVNNSQGSIIDQITGASYNTPASVTFSPNFVVGSNNVTISCTCENIEALTITCEDSSTAFVKNSADFILEECVAGKDCDVKVNVSNLGNVDLNNSIDLEVSSNSLLYENSSYVWTNSKESQIETYTAFQNCSWYNATWNTLSASIPLSHYATVGIESQSESISISTTGTLVQCQDPSDCITCCPSGAGASWCWLNSSSPSNFSCSNGVCCAASEHFEEGACCLSSERCCIFDDNCNVDEWCDNYTTSGYPSGDLFCREKSEIGETCQGDRECSLDYCGGGICADSEPVPLSEWYECAPYASAFCSYQNVSSKPQPNPKGCNTDSDCNNGYYCYTPRRACLACPLADSEFGSLNMSDDGLCASTSCIGYDLDCCTSDANCKSNEWCDASASCSDCSTRRDGVCSSSVCIGIDPDCCSVNEDCGEGLGCIANTCTGNLGETCSGDSQCTGGLKCYGGVCSKETFISLSPEESVYDAVLGTTLKLTLIVNDPQDRQDNYYVEIDPSYIPDSAFITVDGLKTEHFELGAGETQKFLISIAAAKIGEASPDIYSVIRVKSETNSLISDSVIVQVDVEPLATQGIPKAPLNSAVWVLILGYTLAMATRW